MEQEPLKNLKKKKSIIIDLDTFLEKEHLRGEKLLADEPIYIGDNDEVSFRGKAFQQRLPIKVIVGEKENIVTQTTYTLETMELRHGDTIIMEDKEGNIFVEMEILFY